MAEAQAEIFDRDRLYDTRVRADLLDPVGQSVRPTAVVIAGQPGTLRHHAAAAVGQHLSPQVGSFVCVSSDYLRAYHPTGNNADANTAGFQPAVQQDIAHWYDRLLNDTIGKRANLLLVTSMRHPAQAAEISQRLHAASYETSTVVLAVERDRSLQCAALLYEKLHRAGGRPPLISEAAHEDSYRKLRDWVSNVEAESLVERIQILNDSGRQLYANRRAADAWVEPPHGLKALDDYRERRLTARELADNALRWQVLAHRLSSNAEIPRSVAGQAVAWRNDAIARAQTDAEASRLLALGLIADAFRIMDRHQFVREFPKYAKAADRMQQAIDYAQKNLALDTDRDGFIAQARERLAERIEEGRFPVGREREVHKEPPTR